MKKLHCHKTLVFYDEDENSVTKGKLYDVVDDLGTDYMIINDLGQEHYFPKSANSGGLSYKTWFELVEEVGDNERITGN